MAQNNLPVGSIGRIPVLDIWPIVSGGIRPVKAVVGEELLIAATVFREGHDAVAADVILIDPSGNEVTRQRLDLVGEGTDRYTTRVRIPELGLWNYRIEAWSDPLSTWLHHIEVKIPANVDVELEFTEGALLLSKVASQATATDAKVITKVAKSITDQKILPAIRQAVIEDPAFLNILKKYPIREHVSSYGPIQIRVERQRALYGSWYEFFPRSEGAVQNSDGSWQSGTFATASLRLPAIAEMGFDVLYLPPIHPIGRTHRKGPNNSLSAGPNDPGSPWAVGDKTGGHDAIHPDLGSEKDFQKFIETAKKLNIEVALDLALQASPDHPWVAQHPEWFTQRADGSIAYAENPPKKYQDIYPINFDNDPNGIYLEVERIVRHWMKLGVRIFRVDNPHTKPVVFWEWLIARINATDPDIIFLAEAFTRPAMMRVLGEVGFQQSYTYFTWRNTKWEIQEYLTELSGGAAPYMRPNFFVNTPDILPTYLQNGGRPAFSIRAVLAATLSPTWGVYAGFELFENKPTKPGAEEYYFSEKYEFKPRDWQKAEATGDSLAPLISKLNGIRRQHPALQQLRNINFHRVDSDQVICYSKRDGNDLVISIVTLDPFVSQRTMVHFDMPALGFDWADQIQLVDALSGELVQLTEHTEFSLDPSAKCAIILTLKQ